jgi:ParB/RepB/Spo0J family partition protein
MGLVITELALESLSISPLNVRRDPGDLDELTDSVKDIGVLAPILVRQSGEQYEVIAGSRRVQAARQAGQTTIPAIVLEGTDLQAVLISLIENIQRKALTLAERVQTYQALQQLEPVYHSHRGLAKAIGLSHQKITQDFQAYEVLLKLESYGIRVASDLPLSAAERQSGEVLPEYHAVLVHQAMSYLAEAGAVTEADADEKMAELANLIAPLSQEAAKALIEQVKAGEQPAQRSLHHIAEELVPFRQFNPGRHDSAHRRTAVGKGGAEGGLVTCSCCDRVLQLIHRADGTHSLKHTPFTGQPQLSTPAFPPQPVAAALPPAPAGSGRLTSSDTAPALEALGTPQHILKQTTGYTLNEFLRGMNAVLTPQSSGFWGKLTDSPAKPDFAEPDAPQRIFTLNPWLGCLFGTSCQFCYVPSLDTRHYPDGQQSYWYQQWGHWLLFKPDFPNRLRKELLDEAGQPRPSYQGAAVYMSPKTEPLIPIPDALHITARNLDVFLEADCFLMIQTRSPKVVEENEPDILNRIIELARLKKVGVSFSISTDLFDQQRRIERGGLTPEKRLQLMARLKQAGVFVSAAVAPLMPYSPDFARKLVESCHHASIQVLHQTGAGAATPKDVLEQTHRDIPCYRELDRKLADEIDAVEGAAQFSWGINNKGFIGAFLAARRFYETS